ncbi:TPA: DNA topoisomerase IV subunit B, partial [Listeria monocytogenes]
ALSTYLEVYVHREGKKYYQRFERGDVVMDMEEQGETDYRGTIVHFTPDPQIFSETTEFDFDTLRTRTRELAFLNRGLTISIEDKREEHKVRKDF